MLEDEMKNQILEHENERNKMKNDKHQYDQKRKENFKDSIINLSKNSIM